MVSGPDDIHAGQPVGRVHLDFDHHFRLDVDGLIVVPRYVTLFESPSCQIGLSLMCHFARALMILVLSVTRSAIRAASQWCSAATISGSPTWSSSKSE